VRSILGILLALTVAACRHGAPPDVLLVTFDTTGTAIAQDRSDLLDVPLESFTVAAPASAHDYVRVILDEVPPSSSFAQRRESFSVVHEFPASTTSASGSTSPTR
jgi:hypothetical protein